jgi:hypothetical protein
MNKIFLWIILIIIVVGGGLYWYIGEVPGGEHGTQQMSADILPLYTGAEWGEAQATTSPDYGAVTQVQAIAATDTMNIAAASTPFTKYYDDKLKAAGWTQDMAEEASGPGANVSVYRKGDQFIVVMFRSLFKVTHPDAPSECPCDVTLSLMSGI